MSTFDLCRHDCDSQQTYTRRQLLSLHAAAAPVSPSVAQRIQSLGLWTVCRLKHGCVYRYRGCRAGRPRCHGYVQSTMARILYPVTDRLRPLGFVDRRQCVKFVSKDIRRLSGRSLSSVATTYALWPTNSTTYSKFAATWLSTSCFLSKHGTTTTQSLSGVCASTAILSSIGRGRGLAPTVSLLITAVWLPSLVQAFV